MTYVPETANPAEGYPEPESAAPLTITVHPPAETRRPIGFAPWPEEKPARKPKRKKKQ